MSRHRLYLVSLISTAICVGGACGDDKDDAASSESQSMRLFDFGFEMPDQVDGPLIDLAVDNDGTVAHEFAIAQVTPGTTTQQVLEALFDDDEAPADFILGDPGGINMIGAGEQLRYQRRLEPGTYVIFCPFPTADGTSHADHGMAHIFEVTSANADVVPTADSAITLLDDAIELPKLEAGTSSYAITNEGAAPHEIYVAGLPSDSAALDAPDQLGDEIGGWIEGGQVGPAPHDVHFPGGHQTISPGETVVLTMTLRPDHTYQFNDFTGDQPISAVATTP